MTYGLTSQGFNAKTLDIIQSEIEDALKATFGSSINLLPEGVFGQLTGIFSERESLLWELIEAIYYSQYPDTAEGVSLDRVCSLTGITRLAAMPSQIAGMALFGTVGTVVPAGTVFSVKDNPDVKFATSEEKTLGAGTDAVQAITFDTIPTSGSFKLDLNGETTSAIGFDASSSDLQDALNALSALSEVTVSGDFPGGFTVTFGGADGKQPQELLLATDSTLLAGGTAVAITIAHAVTGVYQAQVDCTATETGPLVANAKTLTVIDNPISGLVSVFNPEDASLGRNIETDTELRVRRNNLLQVSVAGPLDAILASILKLNEDSSKPALESVNAFENYTNEVDARGLPAKSFLVIVYQAAGGTTRDQEIFEAIYAAKPAGIQSYGNVSGMVTDSQGFNHTICFSRPNEINIYVDLDLQVTDDYPMNGDDLVKTTLTAWGNNLGVGADVIVYPALISQLASIPGIVDVAIKIGTSPGPTLDNNIDIDDGADGAVELSRWDTSRIAVHHL
ncbi:MAG: baseplate J/gp47 family protein [bacterium]